MTSDDSLSLILRRLEEINDCILEDLRAPTAIGYSVRRVNRPTEITGFLATFRLACACLNTDS